MFYRNVEDLEEHVLAESSDIARVCRLRVHGSSCRGLDGREVEGVTEEVRER